MRYAILVSLCLLTFGADAAPPRCPAGIPLGNIQLTVQRGAQNPPLPLNRVNRLEEGDRILYTPMLQPNEKRHGDVTVVLVAAAPQPDQKTSFTILEAKDASKPAEWVVPFRTVLAVYVYGPSGFSTRKLKGFLSKDHELISQLADYAEKTAETESILQAIARYESYGSADQLSAALRGFAGNSAVSKINRNAPLEEQTLAAFRTLNPALSAYDPISPSAAQRMSQTAGLAATVAGMFLGSTVGLAAGSTAMALNLKTIVFPDTDFRSAYSQPAKENATPLCASREPNPSRKRLGYLWAMRVPDSGAPALTVQEPNTVAPGQKMTVKLSAGDTQWKQLDRVRSWSLRPENGPAVAVQAAVRPDIKMLELNVPAVLPTGAYKLTGTWDWDVFEAQGVVMVHPLETFRAARLTQDTHDRLRQHSGKQVVTLEGADFQFVEKAALSKPGDRYADPISTPFILPRGSRRGEQTTLELQIDTGSLAAGAYALLLYQQDGTAHSVPLKVLPEPPKLANLPLTLHEGEREAQIRLQGEGLDRITGLFADGLEITWDDSRVARVRVLRNLESGERFDLRLAVKDYVEPVVLTNAVRVAPPRPRILEATPSVPADLPISLRPKELPAGVHIGVLLRVASAGREPAIRLSCEGSSAGALEIPAGAERGSGKLQVMQTDTLFLSFDPGAWPSGCSLNAVLTGSDNGQSDAFALGKVIRLPKIESFRLTDEVASPGVYFGVLTGRDLELIGKVGWTDKEGLAVSGLPTPIAGEGPRQSLRVSLPWPSPAPHSPLFLWFRGEEQGRGTRIRY